MDRAYNASHEYLTALLRLRSHFAAPRRTPRRVRYDYAHTVVSPIGRPGYPIGRPGYPIGRPGYPIGRPGYPIGRPTAPTHGSGLVVPWAEVHGSARTGWAEMSEFRPLPIAAHAAWADWLRRWKWDAWITGTCAGRRPTEDMVRGVVRTWLARCATDEAERRGSAAPVSVYAAVAVERGGALGRAHAHVLVGGLGRHPDTFTRIGTLWTWGDVRCAPYDPAQDVRGTMRGAAAYCTKHLDGVSLVGAPRKWRPRRRGTDTVSPTE